jgi:hypothetical protein
MLFSYFPFSNSPQYSLLIPNLNLNLASKEQISPFLPALTLDYAWFVFLLKNEWEKRDLGVYLKKKLNIGLVMKLSYVKNKIVYALYAGSGY